MKKIKWEFSVVAGVALPVGITVGILIGRDLWAGATNIYLKTLVAVTVIFVASWITGFIVIGLAEITGRHSNLE